MEEIFIRVRGDAKLGKERNPCMDLRGAVRQIQRMLHVVTGLRYPDERDRDGSTEKPVSPIRKGYSSFSRRTFPSRS